METILTLIIGCAIGVIIMSFLAGMGGPQQPRQMSDQEYYQRKEWARGGDY